jgi:hypothetical protein
MRARMMKHGAVCVRNMQGRLWHKLNRRSSGKGDTMWLGCGEIFRRIILMMWTVVFVIF